MIRHTVVFSLHHAPGSAEESSFFEAAFALATIEGVEKFEASWNELVIDVQQELEAAKAAL